MRRTILRASALLLLVASLLLAPSPAHAASNDWTPLGPPGFGPSAMYFTVDPQTPTTFYVVTQSSQGAIYKSIDNGLTWQFLDLTGYGVFYATTLLVPDPTNANILYAGITSESQLKKSTDGGETWQVINNGFQPTSDSSFQWVTALAVDPQTPTTLYAVIPYQGLYKSVDGGASWSPSGEGLPTSYAFYVNSFTPGVLVVDPQTPSTVYLIVQGAGVFKTVDAGATWQPANTGLPTEPPVNPADDIPQFIYADWIVPDPQTPTTLYIATRRGIYKSVDAAASWQPLPQEGLPLLPDGYRYISSLNIDPATPQTMLAIVTQQYGANGLYRSTDGGASWTQATTLPITSYGLTLTGDGQTPQTLYLRVYNIGLIYRSTDGGDTWEYAAFGAPNGAAISSFAVDPHDPAKLYAAVEGAGVFRSQDHGQSWTPGNSTQFAAGVIGIMVDPQTPGRLYATTYTGLFTSEDGGDSWQPLGAGLPTNAVAQLIIDPQTPTNLYGQGWLGVLRSEDRGQSWIIANAGLPPGYYNQTPTARSLTLDPQTPTTLYTLIEYYNNDDQTFTTGVFKSTDGARNWAESNKGLPDYSYPAQLVIDPQAPDTLYVRGWPYYPTDAQIYRSVNGGSTWSAVKVRGIATEPGYGVFDQLAVDPNRAGVLYATAGNSFYSSVDRGSHWYALPAGLPKDVYGIAPIIDPTTLGRVYLPTYLGLYTADLSATLAVDVAILGTPPTADWTLTGPDGDFTLPAAGGSHDLGRLDLGAYDLTITPQPDYTVQSICTQGLGAGSQATAHAAAGQAITCTFYAAAPDAPTSRLPIIGR